MVSKFAAVRKVSGSSAPKSAITPTHATGSAKRRAGVASPTGGLRLRGDVVTRSSDPFLGQLAAAELARDAAPREDQDPIAEGAELLVVIGDAEHRGPLLRHLADL